MKRKYQIHESYFTNIESEDQAYFLGLFFADGCNVTGNNEVRLQLQSKDRELLDQLQNNLQPGRPLLASRRDGKDYLLLTACHAQVSADLERHGATSRKSATLKFPTHLPTDILKHFVRGHFDGDGCLYFRYQNNKRSIGRAYIEGRITIVGPPSFCYPLAEYIKTELGFMPNFYTRYTSGIGEMVITGNKRVRQFLMWLYTDATVFLSRKHQKMQDFLAAPTAISQ